MRKILIVCPICNKSKRIPVPESIFHIEEGSLLKIPIKKNTICSHEFILIIDYNFSIRDYEIDKDEIKRIQQIKKKNEDLSIFDIVI
ncbi:MAG: hypothetical protein K9W44_03280 [Candidatus Lokiarchaeota archaeon]|nr:hypothetical protein [Candidatus Harpocratesius repetitus]